MPDVSVVIPVRNRRGIIQRAIDSVARQSLRPKEILVVDDCSTDGTPDFVEGLSTNGICVRVIRQVTHMGASAARNVGVQLAQSPLIAFLDSDDEWLPDKLQLQEAFLSRHLDYSACFCQFVHRHPQGDYLSGTDELDVTEEMLFRHNVIGSTSTAMVRKQALQSVSGFDEALPSCQDWDLWLKLATVGRLRILGEPLLVYYYDDEQRISRNHDRLMQGLNVVLERIRVRADPAEASKVRAHQELLLAALYTSRWPNLRKVVAHGLAGVRTYPSPSILHLFARNIWRYVRHRSGAYRHLRAPS